MAIDDHCGIGLVLGEEQLERRLGWSRVGVLQRAVRKGGGVTGCQEPVSLSQGQFESLGDPQNDLCARP